MFLSVLQLSCGSTGTRSDANPNKIDLTYWAAPNPEEIELANKLVAEWNESHPDVVVHMQPLPVNLSSEEVLMAAIAAKTTPDVCSNIWPGSVPEYARAGALVKLNSFPDFDSLVSVRVGNEIQLQYQSVDGNFYQIPWKTNPTMMIYNKKLFEKAGIESPPRTYSEFLRDAPKLTYDANGDGIIDHWMCYRDVRPLWWQRFFDFFAFYKAACGGKPFARNGEVVADTQAVTEVFNFFRTCFQKGFFPRTYFSYDPFMEGVVASEFVGPWTISYIKKSYGGRLDYGVVPIPVPDGHVGPVDTYGDHKCVAIFSTTKHPRESWEFLKFILSDHADLELMRIASQLPVRQNILTSKDFSGFFKSNPDMKIFAEEVPYAFEVDQTPDQKEIFDAISQEFEKCSVYNVSDPSLAAYNLMRNVNVILNWDK
ncbi:MAG TPA: extracellular solute-binding protein [Candidatus Kryptonia bacterium]